MKKSNLFTFNSFVKSLGLIVCLVLLNSTTFAQDGANDPTFNSSDHGFGIGANLAVKTIAIQSDGKIIIGGSFTSYNGTAVSRITRLNTNGTLDETFIVGTGANDYIEAIAIQSDGKILIGGYFSSYNGTGRNHIARLNANGTLDETFNVGVGANSIVKSIALQSDGKILIGGYFSSYNGTVRNYIARLNINGTLDQSFNIGTGASDIVYTIAIQNDGKIIIGGFFTSYNGTTINRIARLNTDGTLDTTFNVGTGANSGVYTAAIQSDGKIIIGGSFNSYNGIARNLIARLNINGSIDESFSMSMGIIMWNRVYSITIQSDGKIIIGGIDLFYDEPNRIHFARLNTDSTLDATFASGTGPNGIVFISAIQSDGRIIIGGDFGFYNGIAINCITRLNSDGTFDSSFNEGTGADYGVLTSAIQSDGKIIIGGWFSYYNGVARNRIARLNADGTVDGSFNLGTGASGLYSSVRAIAIQSDGKIIIGGGFNSYNGIVRNRIARLNSDGSLDETFNIGTGANDDVYAIALQSDGKIIICGIFNSYNGTLRSGVARLNANGDLDETFINGSGVYRDVYAIAIQSNGKIIISGGFSPPGIIRLNVDGSLDDTFSVGSGLNGGGASAIAFQSNGKIIIGGYFSYYNGIVRRNIARINTNGTLDETFTAEIGPNNEVMSIIMQSDGKIIIGGLFTDYNYISRNRIARLNANGTLDETFVVGSGANNSVYTTALQNDGKIIIGGWFTAYNGTGRNNITRILNSIGTSLPQNDENEVDAVVYPNPTEGKTNIDLGEFCHRANVEVFNICGKLVMQKQYYDTQILDIEINAPAGIYFITITTANKRETLKLIKN